MGESVRKIADVRELQENPSPLPGSSERQDGVGRVLHDPKRGEIDPHVDENLILAFHSRQRVEQLAR